MNKLIVLIGYSYNENEIRKIISKNYGAIFLADNPYCCELLESCSQEYLTTEMLINSDQLCKMGELNYTFLDNTLDKINTKLVNTSSEEYVNGFIDRYYFTFKRVLDCVNTAYLLGKSISERYGSSQVVIYSNSTRPIKYEQNDFNFYDHHFSQCLFKSISNDNKIMYDVHESLKLWQISKFMRRLAGSLFSALTQSINMMKLHWLSLFKKSCIIITDKTYDMAFIMPYFKKDDSYPILVFNPGRISHGMLRLLCITFGIKYLTKKNTKNIYNNIEASFKEQNGNNLPEGVVDYFQNAVLEVLEATYLRNYLCLKLGETLANLKLIRLAISSCISTSAESSFLLGISHGSVQTFHYQHGGGQGYLEKKMSAWFNSQTDCFLCYGKVVKENQKIQEKVKVIPVGSYRLDSVKQNISNKTNYKLKEDLNLICIPSFPLGNRSYYPDVRRSDLFSYVMWKNLLKVIFNKNKDLSNKYVVTVKTEHFWGPRKDYFNNLKNRKYYKHIKVVSGIKMAEYLDQGDVFLTDGPETSLLEIMLTNKPIIFYYSGGFEIEISCKEMLCKRVFWVETEYQLCEVLSTIASKYEECMLYKSDDSFIKYNLENTLHPLAFIDRYLLSKG